MDNDSSLLAQLPSIAASDRGKTEKSSSSPKISPSLLSRIKRFTIVFVVTTAIALGICKRLHIPIGVLLCCFVPNWVVGFISINTSLHERLYDFTGSSTFVACTIYSLVSSHPDTMRRMYSWTWASFHSNPFFRNLIVTAAVVAWAVRLGSFLFFRIIQVGKDDRFDLVRNNKFRFFTFWHIQGLWVFITLMPVHVCNFFRGDPPAWNAVDWSGLAFWTIGFAVEVIADHQKSTFRKKNGHSKDPKWICSGLWAYSRHPNYCGEVLAWIGVALMCYSAMTLWGYAALLSPVFVYGLLTKVSGVPMLESKADNRWGSNPQYQKYKTTTPAMFF